MACLTCAARRAAPAAHLISFGLRLAVKASAIANLEAVLGKGLTALALFLRRARYACSTCSVPCEMSFMGWATSRRGARMRTARAGLHMREGGCVDEGLECGDCGQSM